jgi:hypothetical protein
MPLTHEIDSVRRIVIVTLSGELTDERLFTLYDELKESPEIRTDFAILIDLRQASGRNLTSAGVGALAQRPLMLSPEARRAVVVPSDFGSGMARMYNALREAQSGEVAIFRNFAEAMRWIETGEAEPHGG